MLKKFMWWAATVALFLWIIIDGFALWKAAIFVVVLFTAAKW